MAASVSRARLKVSPYRNRNIVPYGQRRAVNDDALEVLFSRRYDGMFQLRWNSDYIAWLTHRWRFVAKTDIRLPLQNVDDLMLGLVMMRFRFTARLYGSQNHFEGVAKGFIR
jgi:hypothetical protein